MRRRKIILTVTAIADTKTPSEDIATAEIAPSCSTKLKKG